MPLEIRLRSILIKDVADITEEDIKELRTTRQTKTEMWMYDEAKILMVQSAYRKRKANFKCICYAKLKFDVKKLARED